MAFEYRYSFSVDEEIIDRYGCGDSRVRYIYEIRSNFRVKGRVDDRERRIVGSERYAVKGEFENTMTLRLKDYWMPDHQIHRLVNEAMLFAAAAIGRRIPVAVDLEVYTLQQEGEAIDATVERAMRPEFLPPPHLFLSVLEPLPDAGHTDSLLMHFLRYKLPTIRVEDADKALSIMKVCPSCDRKPVVGTQITELRCGHAFHYHCIVRCMEWGNDKACPICHLPAARASSDHSARDCGYTLAWDDLDDYWRLYP